MKRGYNLTGINNKKYNFGIRYTRNYRYLFMPKHPNSIKSGYILEHVYVFQEYYKCCILPWGEIHHIDRVRKGYCNNMIWNLMGVTKSQHRTLDRTKDMSNRRCSKCNNDKTALKPNGRPIWYGKTKLLCKKCYEKNKK